MTSLAQSQVQDTEASQTRQPEADHQQNTRSEQLLVMPTEPLTDSEWLARKAQVDWDV